MSNWSGVAGKFLQYLAILCMGFGVSYYFNWEAGRSNERMLHNIKTVSLPIHHNSSHISFYTDELIRLYERAVITEDEEALEESAQIIRAIKSNLTAIATIYASDKEAYDKILKLKSEFDSYAISSEALSRKLIMGQVSLLDVHEEVEAQNNLVNKVKIETEKLKTQSHTNILQAIENSKQNIERTEKITITVFWIILGMVAVFYFLVRSSILSPILAISATSQKATSGNFDYVATKPPNNEIGILISNFNNMILKIKRNRNQLSAIEKESQRLSSCGSFDSLIAAIPESITRVTLGEVDEGGLAMYFRDTCFIEEQRRPGFYQWRDGEWHLADMESRGVNRENQHIQPIRDPRTGKVIGFMAYLYSESMPEETYKAVEVLATPVANAVAAIMLEQATQLIQKKTDEMALVLDNIEQGIFVTDASFAIGPSYSPRLDAICGSSDLAGTCMLNRVFFGISSEVKKSIETVMLCSIGEDQSLGFDCNVTGLPTKITRLLNDKVQILQVKWVPIVDAQDIVREIMVCIEDVTELKALESQQEQNRAEMKRVYRLIKMGDRSFINFVHTSNNFYQRIISIGSHQGSSLEGRQQLKLELHKHKGTSRILGMADIATAAHEMEDTVEAVGYRNDGELSRQIQAYCEHSQHLLENYKKAYTELLGKPLDRTERLFDIETLRFYVRKWQRLNQFELKHLDDYLAVRHLGWTDLSSIVREISDSFRKTRKLNLPINDRLDDTFISEGKEQVIRDCLVHLFNNSIDHGKVVELGASIEVWQSNPSPDSIVYHYRDDGAGLNLEKIKHKLIEKGDLPKAEVEQMSVVELANSIFTNGLSSKDDVSETSGRGVGMDVVRQGIESLYGKISVELNGEIDPTRQGFQVNMEFSTKVIATIDDVLNGKFKKGSRAA